MSFPPGTEMFQFPGFASDAYVFSTGSPDGGVSPFGHPRINDRSHLPAAYRSVPRPSSPLGAKASTERPSHTHHSAPPARRTKPQIPTTPKGAPGHRVLATARPIGQRRNTETLTTRREVSPPGPRYSPNPIHLSNNMEHPHGQGHASGVFRSHDPTARAAGPLHLGGDRIRTDDPLLAKQALSR